jgi:DNA-binding transcriptional LysR family regulator
MPIEVANRYRDLIDNNIDVAIRTREFENNPSITVRRLATTRRVLAASRGCLDVSRLKHLGIHEWSGLIEPSLRCQHLARFDDMIGRR